MEITPTLMFGMYETMYLIRRFEERTAELFKAGRFPGWVHICIGQEATATGACFALREDDFLCPCHRGHGQCLAKGMSPLKMMAELYGKKSGSNLGRGGSMHLCDLEKGILCDTGLGTGLPLTAGVAMSAKLSGTDRVALVFFGEGASNEGIVHEAMNLAALWMLPVIFLCESNQYAELSPRSSHLKIDTLARRADGYGMPGVTVDGNDVLEVYQVTTEAVKRARGGEGPTLIDAITCRWHGHYEGDPQAYRLPGEIEDWRKKDPILRLEQKLFSEKLLSEEDKKEILERVDRSVVSAVEFAESSPYPRPEEALELVYVDRHAMG